MSDNASIASDLRTEIASVKRDIYHPYVGRLLLNEDETLLTRGGLRNLRLYDDIERDARIFSVMQKRKMAILAYPWMVDAASGSAADKEVAALVTNQLGQMNFKATCVGLLDAILKGYAVGEIMWIIDGNSIRPDKVIARDQRRFRFDIDYQLRLLTIENMLEGEALPDRKFIVHSVGAKDGSPYGLGLGTRLFWIAFFKRHDITFWLAFLDKFGSPTTLGKYPSGTSPDAQAELLNVLRSIAQDAGVIVPEGMAIEFLEATRTGSVDGYERLARYMDEQSAEIVLGETLTTNIGDTGSMAAAQTHNGVRLELAQADSQLLASALNGSLVRWIVDLNRPGAGYPSLRWEVKQQEDQAARAARDVDIANMGFQPSLAYITGTYGDGWAERGRRAPIASDLAAFGEGRGRIVSLSRQRKLAKQKPARSHAPRKM